MVHNCYTWTHISPQSEVSLLYLHVESIIYRHKGGNESWMVEESSRRTRAIYLRIFIPSAKAILNCFSEEANESGSARERETKMHPVQRSLHGVSSFSYRASFTTFMLVHLATLDPPYLSLDPLLFCDIDTFFLLCISSQIAHHEVCVSQNRQNYATDDTKAVKMRIRWNSLRKDAWLLFICLPT